MIAVDANLLVYAYSTDFDRHSRAREWLEDQLQNAPRVGLPWASLLAFLRLVTNPRMFQQPASLGEAWEQVQNWLSADNVWIPTAGDRHGRILGQFLALPGLRANDVPDAHLAALAVEHGLTLATNDAGFARFPALNWSDPLQSG